MSVGTIGGPATSTRDHAAPGFHFLRHLLEMTLAMMVGMMGSAAVFLTAAGTTVDVALRRHAVLFLLAQAIGMTVAMVGWMRLRGHAWRACSEMAGAMVAPAVPLVPLAAAGLLAGRVCGLYCVASLAAMVGLMVYRRSEYGGMPAVGAGT